MNDKRVRKNMEVIGADGIHIGTVDRVENGKIRLTILCDGLASSLVPGVAVFDLAGFGHSAEAWRHTMIVNRAVAREK